MKVLVTGFTSKGIETNKNVLEIETDKTIVEIINRQLCICDFEKLD